MEHERLELEEGKREVDVLKQQLVNAEKAIEAQCEQLSECQRTLSRAEVRTPLHLSLFYHSFDKLIFGKIEKKHTSLSFVFFSRISLYTSESEYTQVMTDEWISILLFELVPLSLKRSFYLPCIDIIFTVWRSNHILRLCFLFF